MQRWKVVRAIDGATLCKGDKWRILPMESEIMTYSSCGRAMKYGFAKVKKGKLTLGNIVEWATATRIDNN